jgi:hypothetical protein
MTRGMVGLMVVMWFTICLICTTGLALLILFTSLLDWYLCVRMGHGVTTGTSNAGARETAQYLSLIWHRMWYHAAAGRWSEDFSAHRKSAFDRDCSGNIFFIFRLLPSKHLRTRPHRTQDTFHITRLDGIFQVSFNPSIQIRLYNFLEYPSHHQHHPHPAQTLLGNTFTFRGIFRAPS